MSKPTIEVNPTRVGELSRTLQRLHEQLTTIGRNLDTALRPARRTDVPELAAIDALYGAVRKRTSTIGVELRNGATDLRRYVARLRQVEQMLQRLRTTPRWEAVRLGASATVAPVGSAQGLEGVAMNSWELATHHLPGVSHYAFLGLHDLTALQAHRLAVTKALVPLGLVLDGRTMLDGHAVVTDRAHATVSVVVTSTGVTGGGLAAFGVAGGTTMVSAAAAAAPYLAASGIGLFIGNAMREGYERDEVAGRSSLRRIWSGRISPATGAAALVDTAGLGVYKAAAWAGGVVWSDDHVPDQVIGNHQAAIILAQVRAEHPEATITQLDGRFRITIPNASGVATKLEFDNASWKALR